MRPALSRTALAALLLLGLAVAPASQAAPIGTGRAWEPAPASKELYGTKPPDADPERQRTWVEGHDGTDLYVETWLPAAKDGKEPPAEVPTVLIMTPYVSQGVEEYPGGAKSPNYIKYMTSRGYAVAQAHVRGTGESGGCLEQTGPNQIEDGARVVEYLGRDAPWSNGKVGMYGVSYDAETQISVAGLGDPKKTKYLKAIVPVASVGGQYEYSVYDGVPYREYGALSALTYLGLVSVIPGQVVAPQRYAEKFSCQATIAAGQSDQSGDMTPVWAEREYRPGVKSVKAATLFVHGLRDFNVQPMTASGWFDRLPKSTPHKGLLGVWNHAVPSSHAAVEPDWERIDWWDMQLAWFDRYLKGAKTGVERWPEVQVQASDGQWRAEPEFPASGGPVGQLALSAEGALGVTRPAGTTTYREAPTEAEGRAVFTTAAVKAPLHLTGQPVLDLWLTTDQPDGHLAARVEVLDADGEVLRHAGTNEEPVATYGYRSLQHLDPMPKGWFEQAKGKPVATGTPVRAQVRFLPTDLVVPTGGRLRVTIAGVIAYAARENTPSGSLSQITLLHDCEHPSALRFTLPTPKAPLLDVRERLEEDEPLSRKAATYSGKRDGAGLASAKVCGKAPLRLPAFGPVR